MKNTILVLLIFSPIWLFGQPVDSVAMKTVDSLILVSRELTGRGDFAKALDINAIAEALVLEKWGQESVGYGNTSFNQGRVLYYQGNYPEAEKWYLQAQAIREKLLGKEDPDYARSLNNLALLYRDMGNYEKAELLYNEALAIRGKVLGKENTDYAVSLNNLGNLYLDMGNYEKAELLQLEAKAIREKTIGKEHTDYAASLVNLGLVYRRMSNYEKAEPFYIEAKSINEKALGKENLGYAMNLHNLANLYLNMGSYGKAEPLYLEAIAIRAKALGNEHTDYAISLGNLAILYMYMGNYEKAEPLYLEALGIKERKLGKQHLSYAVGLNNLAILYKDMGNYEKAEPLYLEASSILEKALGKEHPDCLESLRNLAILYKEMGNYKKAEQLYLEVKTIQEKVMGKEHSDYAMSLSYLADLYREQGQYEKAELLYLEAKAIQEKALGRYHPQYAYNFSGLTSLYKDKGDYKNAERLFVELNNLNQSLIIKAFHYLSEQELYSYVNIFATNQNEILSFAQLSKSINSGQTCFDYSLFHKGFLLNAANQVKRLALSDPVTTDKFNQLKSYRRRLAAEYAKPIAERKNMAELEEKANTLEKDLTRSVAGFGEALQQVTWQEVQQNLQPGEAAIEFVHYKFTNPKPTDSTMYAALVLLPGAKAPKFIALFDEKQLTTFLEPDGKPKPDYVNDLYALGSYRNSLYDLLWRPLELELSEVNTVYFSPSGQLHRLNIGAVPMPPMLRGDASETTLADRYQLVELGSTRQLAVGSRQSAAKGTDALLYGGIKYEMDSMAIASAISSLDDNPLATRRGLDFANADSTLRGGKWNYLRWTDVEVNSTQDILLSAGLQATARKGYDATEESFKAIGTSGPSPRVLHLATHGFFFPDPGGRDEGRGMRGDEPVFKLSEHPMIRAGLVLAGGNYAWQTGKPIRLDREDGILTAYEISQMNLSNTELVVLSACETGLGDIQGNEGVYGLQRAFKIAGAKYLIMSLWQVPDFQTQELMTSFYSLWLEDKMSIHDAFQAAQKEMKEKYKSPFLWAGFVLVE